jgi:hypothetical protein
MFIDRNFSKNVGKMNIQPILNKILPWARMELDLHVLGVARKLVKYVVHGVQIASYQVLILRNF